jgi:hypothetical protein
MGRFGPAGQEMCVEVVAFMADGRDIDALGADRLLKGSRWRGEELVLILGGTPETSAVSRSRN